MSAIVQGKVSYDDGCLRLDEYPVVWPHGTTWDNDSDEVVLPGGGGYVSLQNLERGTYGDYGDYGAQILQDCVGATGEVAVFNKGDEGRLATTAE